MQIAGSTSRPSVGTRLVPFAPLISLIIVLSLLVPFAPGPEMLARPFDQRNEPWTGPWWAAGEPLALHWSFLSLLLLSVLIGLISWLSGGDAGPVPQRWRLPFAAASGLVIWLSPAVIAVAVVPHREGTTQALPITAYSLIIPVLLAAAWYRATSGAAVRSQRYERVLAVSWFVATLCAVSLLLFFALLMLAFID